MLSFSNIELQQSMKCRHWTTSNKNKHSDNQEQLPLPMSETLGEQI